MMDITAHWHWPQWTWLLLSLMTLLVHFIKHGEQRADKHNGFVGIFNFALGVFILTCGGFFA